MKQLNKILTNTNWATVSNTINNNNDRIFSSVSALEHAAFKQKGYYKTLTALKDAYPYAESGSQAFVYNASNGSAQPYDIYEWDGNNWVDTGVNGGSTSVNLDSKQDTIHGYTENVANGQVTQIALQADTIALSGKVSLGNVDNMESAILMSSSQAGAAIAKANTLEQSMNALKSPVKPIHLNSQGKLELNIGKGLYVEDGKLCTTGASGGGGGGGKTYSEGAGISIQNDKISVAYNVETLTTDECGGITVNYDPDTLKIKNGKLSAQTSVNAGNGLVKKGDALQVRVGTGLGVAEEVYVNLGKGLATDNLNKVNVNLDEQTLTTDSSGKVIVKKEGLIGNGLKQEYSKLAVNYGTGLALSNKAIVVKYGSGLDINSCGKLYVKDGGKTYIGGQAVDISGNEINVKYDGVTISTKDTTDNSLHVVLGSGLTQGTNGINLTEDILNLSTRVYELGDFASSGEAENKAKEASISGDNEIVIMRYTVSSAKKQGVILQQVGDYRTIQYLLWDGGIYTRYIWFTNDTRQTLNSNLNAREKWWKLGATHTNYDSSTRKIHLANKDDSNINANESAVIPIVSSSVAGLMSSDMLDTLNGSQPQLERYSEGLSGTKTTASINADEISMSGSSLKLHNVLRVCGALFTDLQTKGNININAKSVIASNIDAGELKVLNGASNYGFILRTVDNPNDPQGLMLVELLSTDGYDSYKYTFPAKSGEVALKGDYSEGDGIRIIDDKINVAYDLETIVLDDCGGLAVNFGSGLEMHCGRLCAVKQDGKTYTGGDGISVDNTTNEVSFKYGTSLESVCGAIQVAISSGLAYDDYNHFKIRVKGGKGIDIPSDGTVNVALGQGLVFDKWNKLTLSLHEKSGLQVTSEGLGVNAGVALGTADGKLNVQYGTGLGKGSDNKLEVLIGTGLALDGNYIKIADAEYTQIEAVGGKQDKLLGYSESKNGDNTLNVNVTASHVGIKGTTDITITSPALNLNNVTRINGALFTGMQTKGDINLNAKSIISASIDPGELKVLHRGSTYGFIARTVDNPSDPYGLMLVELLSTDGYSSYKYTFPAKSGDVALKSDLSSKQNTLTYGTGINISGDTITVNYGTGLSVSGGKLYSTVQSKTYVSGHAINVNNSNEINVKYDGVTISTKDTADNSLHVMLSSGLRQGTSGVEVAYGTGLAMGSDNKLYATVEGKTYTAGSGVSISSDNAVSVNYGTALGISNSKVCLKYSTSYLSLDDSGFLTINIESLKTALGI